MATKRVFIETAYQELGLSPRGLFGRVFAAAKAGIITPGRTPDMNWLDFANCILAASSPSAAKAPGLLLAYSQLTSDTGSLPEDIADCVRSVADYIASHQALPPEQRDYWAFEISCRPVFARLSYFDQGNFVWLDYAGSSPATPRADRIFRINREVLTLAGWIAAGRPMTDRWLRRRNTKGSPLPDGVVPLVRGREVLEFERFRRAA